MVRTQLYLDEDLHERLRELSKKQERTVSDLVREALTLVYLPSLQTDERVATLKEIDGLWQNRDDLESSGAYVRHLRRGTRRKRDQS